MVFERPRGVRDFGPKQMLVRDRVEQVLSRVFSSYSYRRVQMPSFEFVELFELKSGADIKGHLYVFEDKGGRRLCLRPEATASVARMYASGLRSLPKPVRLSYYGPMFRYEEPQKGRYREFWQAGVELYGVSASDADAEVICLASDCLKALGLKFTLRVSHIGVIRSLLEGAGLKGERQDEILQLLDKGDFDAVKERVGDESFTKLMGLRGGRGIVDSALKLPLECAARDQLLKFQKTLSLLDVAHVEYEVDFSMSRGLDYYTGIVFDVKVDGLGAQDQIAGGGRYDRLVKLFQGPDTPAVGFAFGVDRIVESLRSQSVSEPEPQTDVFVVAVSEELRDRAFKIAVDLRRQLPDYTVDYELSSRKLPRALQHASNIRARYAVIVGAKELNEDSVMLKDMESGKQSKVKYSELASHLS